MSRSALRNIAAVIFVWSLFGAPLGAAQDQSPVTAEQAIGNAEKAFGPPPPKPKCDPQEGDEIVVCAEEQEQSQFRVKSSSELDPTSEEAIKDGLPRAPDVGGAGIFKGPATVGGLCFIPPCPKPAALIIDVTALPEAPPGSDADRIARGLPPLGKDQEQSETVDELTTTNGTPREPSEQPQEQPATQTPPETSDPPG